MKVVADIGATETTLTIAGATTAEITHLLLGLMFSGAEVLVDPSGKGLGVRELFDAAVSVHRSVTLRPCAGLVSEFDTSEEAIDGMLESGSPVGVADPDAALPGHAVFVVPTPTFGAGVTTESLPRLGQD